MCNFFIITMGHIYAGSGVIRCTAHIQSVTVLRVGNGQSHKHASFRGPTNPIKLDHRNLTVIMDVDCMFLGHDYSTRREFRSRRRLRMGQPSYEEKEQRGVISTPQEAMEGFLHRTRTLLAIYDYQGDSGLKVNTQPLLCKKSARYQACGMMANVHCIVIKKASLVVLVGFTVINCSCREFH